MSSQQSVAQYVESGQQPFFRCRNVNLREGGVDADVVVFGVPYDGGCTYRPGARFGPYHVRRTSARVEGFHPGHRVDVFDALRVVDGGNAMTPPFNPGAMREVVQQFTAAVIASGASPFVVGGDHSITLPILRALVAARGPLALVHVDAHSDTSDGKMWREEYHHGTPIRHAIDEGLVAPGKVFQVGLRGPGLGPDDHVVVDAVGARRFSADSLGDLGPSRIAHQIRTAIGEHPTYVSFDIDAVDPAYAPGTGTPVPGGLTSREALALLRGLAGIDVAGMDLVEVCPDADVSDATSTLASHLLWEGLALKACHVAAD